MAADNPNKARFQSQVTVGSEQIAQTEIFDLVITSEVDHPDSIAITLTRDGATAHASKMKVTDDFKVKLTQVNDEQDWAFSGELSGVEPVFSPTGKSGGNLVIRGLNAMHALTRGKRSVAYTKGDDGVTDKDIIDQVLQRNSALKLTADYGGNEPTIKYPHVYQHNQTDLEFIRHRASRLGYWTLVRDKKLLFQKRPTTPSGMKLVLNAPRTPGDDANQIALERFVPRVSTAAQVTQVKVRCWNPETRKELIGIAPQSGSSQSLAANDGKSAISDKHPDSIVVRTDIPFSSLDEGNQIAASILNERQLGYVTAEGTVPGDPRLKPGLIVEMSTGNPICDGKYFITYVRHSYRTHGNETRFVTDFRAKRDATGQAQSQ